MGYTVRQNPAYGGNYSTGRFGSVINKIVIHHAATTSFNGIGATFKTPGRGASAHYGVGRQNNVDQYVSESNTAWHCGNWAGNTSSIGIENVNSTGSPTWDIDEKTVNTLVELVRDIAKRNGLGKLVVGKNFFGHKDFSATACPMDLYPRLAEIARRANEGISSGSPAPAPSPGKKSNGTIANEVIAGKWGNGPDRIARLKKAGYNPNTIQSIVNDKLSGKKPAAPAKKSIDTIAREVIDGKWGNGPARQSRLQAVGYNYNTVQAAVNRMLGGYSAPARKSNETIANQVIAGKWGNGPTRVKKLRAAGYDPNAIQAIVNRKLS